MKVSRGVVIGIGICIVLTFLFITRFDFQGHYEGIFLLKDDRGSVFEVKDDLYLGDGHRLLLGIDFDDPRYRIAKFFDRNKHDVPYLYHEWVAKDGEGFVRNFLPGGRQILTCFSRFIDDGGKQTAGLFVGGGLPENAREDDIVKMNETGMAYFDGKRWYHIWCNANEAIASGKTLTNIYPSQWKYLGSKVLNRSDKSLTISSSHVAQVDNVPLRIDRIAHFSAGDAFFTLVVRITNTGKSAVNYYYMYGDEPWLGNFGTSGGNVGWVKDRLVQYVERIDSKKYSYAGLVDYGNDVLNEGHDFTLTANFLEWRSEVPPLVYFSNGPYEHAPEKPVHEPLKSNARFIGIQWGPLVLNPGQRDYYSLTIGMATFDPKAGLPVKPATHPQ